METISLKIEKEDKEIMFRFLYMIIIEDKKKKQKTLPEAVRSAGLLSVYQKISRSLDNEKAISLNLMEVFMFEGVLRAYVTIGDYEMANGLLLIEQIKNKLSKKNITI